MEIEQRMPWLSGFLALVHWGLLFGVGRVGRADGALDRILADKITANTLDPAKLPALLRIARTSLFPNNSLAPPRAIPDAEQALQLRRKAAEAIVDTLPDAAVTIYFVTSEKEQAVDQVEQWLDVLSDPYLNRHLMIRIVELIIVRLMPELSERGVSELLEERLGGP